MSQIKRFRPSRRASYFSPSHLFQMAPGASVSKDFRGYDGAEFAFNRLSFGTLTPHTIVVSAKLNNERDIFSNVHISALQDMFRLRSLLAPFIIAQGNILTITLTNLDTVNPASANVQLLGFDHETLREWRQFNSANSRSVLEPVFVYGTGDVPAQQQLRVVNLTSRSKPVHVHRFFAGSNGANDLLISLEVYNDQVKRDLYIAQLNDEFLSMPALMPYYIGENIPISMYVTNNNATDVRTVSIIGEGYYA
jgi:hypothetical protein